MPIELAMDPEEYKKRLRAEDEKPPEGPRLLGLGVEVFRSSASETEGGADLLDRARRRLGYEPTTYGADEGFVSVNLIRTLLERQIAPHIATDPRPRQPEHSKVRMRVRGLGYKLSQRARKKIEELLGEAKDWHGLRRFRRRGLARVRQETLLIGWVLNLKRLAKALEMGSATA